MEYLELERLKEQVVYNIRDNNEREKEVSSLDVKIALLIKNRTSLEDVVETSAKFMKKMKREHNQEVGLKSLDKEARHKLEGYQHLFYLLQTEPHYMAKLIFQMRIQDDVQKFVETIVLTLYGYAQNAREEYLLLKLFEYALEEEMKQVLTLFLLALEISRSFSFLRSPTPKTSSRATLSSSSSSCTTTAVPRSRLSCATSSSPSSRTSWTSPSSTSMLTRSRSTAT